MMMSVNERIKEIGIMRSIGTQKKEVMSMFIYEAAIIGIVGSLIGGFISLIPGLRDKCPDVQDHPVPLYGYKYDVGC